MKAYRFSKFENSLKTVTEYPKSPRTRKLVRTVQLRFLKIFSQINRIFGYSEEFHKLVIF